MGLGNLIRKFFSREQLDEDQISQGPYTDPYPTDASQIKLGGIPRGFMEIIARSLEEYGPGSPSYQGP